MFGRNRTRVTGTLKIMSINGDDVLTWDKDRPSSVEDVKARFDQMIRVNKMWAYTIPERGESLLIRDFDPDAELIEMHEQNVGG